MPFAFRNVFRSEICALQPGAAAARSGAAAIDTDIVLLRTDEVKKVITGADLFGGLLRRT